MKLIIFNLLKNLRDIYLSLSLYFQRIGRTIVGSESGETKRGACEVL